ncbi:MAG TPA: MerR family DNA-binding transcriptional regulator [Candidatus Portnoybacteria bacterium]|nr:MerR family DNA-binding transcriptional regulator [Candidatus Portnoybacteria bacterium]
MKAKYITIKQAAKFLHVTPTTLRNWDKSGKLRSYRHPINNYRLYRLDQIELFIRRIERSTVKKMKRKIDIY